MRKNVGNAKDIVHIMKNARFVDLNRDIKVNVLVSLW